MRFNDYPIIKLIMILTLLSVLVSCTSVGPVAISSGRLTYNDAIITTENQQMLMVAVQTRYEERIHLLSVASVTANVSLSTRAGFQIGSGSNSSYAGNLVPFDAGFVYEENPTISYVPVGGEQYTQRLFSPIAIDAFAQLAGSFNNPSSVYLSLISGINDINNPDFLLPKMNTNPRFLRIIDIMSMLTQANRLQWISDESHDRLYLSIDRPDNIFTEEINEMLSLLKLKKMDTGKQAWIIPVSTKSYQPNQNFISLKTRSVWAMVELLASAIEVPKKDHQNNMIASYPKRGLSASLLHVYVSKEKPSNTYVTVPHNDRWFYIKNSDHSTKRFFRLLGNLMYATMADTMSGSSSAPVLTVPVSG